jgi:TetR/AcrR family transcriptional regulator
MATTPPKSPARGRPASRHAEDRRALLLDAALELFARQGIAATSLNTIARQARVTPALVHYYFGNREQLVEALVAERIMPVVDSLSSELGRQDDDPLQALYALANRLLATLRDLPWLPPLWVREVLCEGGLLRAHLLRHIAPLMAKRVQKLAKAAQDAGRMNAALDPRLVIVSLIGLTLLPLAAAPIWQQLPGYQSITAERLAQHMLELLANGLENNTKARSPVAAARSRVNKTAASKAAENGRRKSNPPGKNAREKKPAAKSVRTRAAKSPPAGEKHHARTD